MLRRPSSIAAERPTGPAPTMITSKSVFVDAHERPCHQRAGMSVAIRSAVRSAARYSELSLAISAGANVSSASRLKSMPVLKASNTRAGSKNVPIGLAAKSATSA